MLLSLDLLEVIDFHSIFFSYYGSQWLPSTVWLPIFIIVNSILDYTHYIVDLHSEVFLFCFGFFFSTGHLQCYNVIHVFCKKCISCDFFWFSFTHAKSDWISDMSD